MAVDPDRPRSSLLDAQRPTNRWDAGLYDEQHSFVWKYGAELIDLLDPQPGERIVDLGSGTGHLTARIADLGAEVVGLDSSPAMVEQARQHYPALEFLVADGSDFHLAEPVDALFSNATLHWIKPPKADAAAACIARALRPGGRFIAELGGKGCDHAVITAIAQVRERAGLPPGADLNPWWFPRIGEYATLLEGHGLAVSSARLFYRPTPLDGGGAGLRNWLRMFAESFFRDVAAEQREPLVTEVENELRPQWYQDGTWIIDYWRLRLVAAREPG